MIAEHHDLALAAEGVKRSILVERRESSRIDSRHLGFAHVDYGRLFIRDRWTLFAIAVEIGCTIEEILEEKQPQRSSTGPSWTEIVSAAERVLSAVRHLPAQQREIVLLRSGGLGWRKIGKRMPSRILFSIVDDFAAGVAELLKEVSDDLRLLATAEKIYVAKTSKRC